MAVLTAATSELGCSIAAHLRSSGVELSLTSRDEHALGHDESTDVLCAGRSSVIHLEPALVGNDGEADDDWLDTCTRCTFNLLVAAEAAGCSDFVLLSRMDVFVNLDHDLGLVSPTWRPRPSVSPGSLGPHLAEFTARQFAFSAGPGGLAYEPIERIDGEKMRVTVLRLGDPGQAASSRFWTNTEAICAALAAVLETPSSSKYTVSHCGDLNPGWSPGSPSPTPAAPAKPRGEGWSAASWAPAPKCAILGANGMMGPPVGWALANAGSEILLTDLDPESLLRDKAQLARDEEFGATAAHQRELFALPAHAVVTTQRVDASKAAEVEDAVAQSEVVVMCAVVREDRELAFRVNTQGTFNASEFHSPPPLPMSLDLCDRP